MTRFLSTVSAILLAVVFFVPPAAGADPSPLLKVGFAERDITPDLGMEMPGGYGKVFHTSVHDPCKVRVAVFDDGAKRVVLVGVDALMVPRHLVDSVRDTIRKECGIPPEAVLIGASHSHSSGPTGMVQPGQFDKAPPLARSLAYDKSSCADPRYLEKVQAEIVAGIREANAKRAEARCGIGSGVESTVAFNRRFRMKNGLTFTHPGKGNLDIAGVAGPIDPQVGVIGAWDSDGRLLGCVVNYACHATTSPPGISANWICYLEKAIRGAFEPTAVVVFLQGDSGDVTQVDNLSTFEERPGDESARFVGGRVGAEAVKVLLGMARGPLGPVDSRSKNLRLRHRVPDPERVKQCTELAQKDPEQIGHTEWTFAKEIVLLDAMLAMKKEPIAEAEVQAIQVGPAIFLSNPGETFCQFGVELKGQSPFAFTFPVELANGCVGYIPTEEALGERGGGYETRLTAYSNLEPTAGSQMNEAALELARQMKPGQPPQRSPAPPFGGPWSYGSVPPELK